VCQLQKYSIRSDEVILISRIYIIMLSIALAGFVIAGCTSGNGSPSQVGQQYQRTPCIRPSCQEVSVKRQDVNISSSIAGSLRYVEEGNFTFDIDGRISTLDVEVGDWVSEGQLIATLDTSALALDLVNAQFAAEQLKQTIGEVESQLPSGEFKAIVESGVIIAELRVQNTRFDLKRSLDGPLPSEIAAAQAQILTAASDLDTAEEDFASIVSPGEFNRDEMEHQIALARNALNEARETLRIMQSGPDPDLLAVRQRALDSANIALLRAQIDLRDLRDLVVSQSSLEYLLAEAVLDRANSDLVTADQALSLTMSEEPTELDLADARQAIVGAELALEMAIANWEMAIAIRANLVRSTTVSLSQADAVVANRQVALQTARTRLNELVATTDLLRIRELENLRDLADFQLSEAKGRLANLEDTWTETLERLRAELNLANARVILVETQLQSVTLTAPFDGQVIAVNFGPGDTVQDTEVVARIVDNRNIKFVSIVGESEATNLEIGNRAKITFPELPTFIVFGNVKSVSPTELQEAGNTDYEAVILGEALRLDYFRAGMPAQAQVFAEGKENVLVIPIAAVRDSEGKRSVEVLREGTWSLVNVAVGLTDGALIEVSDGLQEGETIRIRADDTDLPSS